MKSILKLCVIIVFCFSCQAQNNESQLLQQKIKSYLTEIETDGFSGSVLVAYKGKAIISNGYGFSNKSQNIKNSSKTIFDIGSITKQFTAAGILKLEEQGKLSVKDKITKYFDTVPTDKESITLHHLLTHSSGLRPAIGDDYQIISEKDFISKALQYDLLFAEGTAYEYSNVGYSLLAMIIEKVSNQSYEDFLYQNLWKPSQMEQTGYIRPSYNQNMIAVGYKNSEAWGKPNEKWDNEVSWHLKGNGGVLSTVEDMYKWHEALLTNKILSKKSKEKYYAKHIKEGEGAQSFYGYGWAIFPTPRNTYLVAHNGGNGIFFADFWRYLTEDITIIMMTNTSKRSYQMLNMEIAGIILKPDYKPNTSSHESNEVDIEDVVIDELAESFVNVLQVNDENKWKTFIVNHTTKDFINMAPMSMHLEMFRKMHIKLKGQNIRGIGIMGDEIEIMLNNNTLILGIELDEDNELKIAGVQLN